MARFREWLGLNAHGRHAEAALSGEVLRAILGHIVVPLFVLDREGKVAFWNEAVEKLTGLAASEVLGTKSHWRGFYPQARPCLADLVFKGDDAQVSSLYAAQESGGLGKGRMRARNWCDLPKGARVYLQIDAGAIYDDQGRIHFVVETLQDQTILKDAELVVEKSRHAQAAEFEAVRVALGAGLGRLAKGDLSAAIETDLPAGAEALRTDFNAAIQSLGGMVAHVRESAREIDADANQIAISTRDVTEQSRRQRDELAEAVRSLNSITATVRDNAKGAENAREIVARAKAEAEKSGAVVREAIAAINEIEKSSKQIGQIIGAIDEIAFQTNLLALNAGVEAARAGDAGKGFAVVAFEVRGLALRSAEAAKEIKTLVMSSDAQVSRGVALAGDAGDALEGIVGQVAKLNDAVAEIARHAHEQANALQQVDAAMNGVDQVMERTSALVDASAGAAQALAQEISRLQETIIRLRVEGDGPASDARWAAE
jgi:methyl-accepting chemotaxis protein